MVMKNNKVLMKILLSLSISHLACLSNKKTHFCEFTDRKDYVKPRPLTCNDNLNEVSLLQLVVVGETVQQLL